jgi:hypothetical protein
MPSLLDGRDDDAQLLKPMLLIPASLFDCLLEQELQFVQVVEQIQVLSLKT